MDEAAAFGAIDILVNCAGIQHTAALAEMPAERWDAIIAINLSAAFHTMRAALPGMAARGYGRVINIASVHGLVASVNKAAYVAAAAEQAGASIVLLDNSPEGKEIGGGKYGMDYGMNLGDLALPEDPEGEDAPLPSVWIQSRRWGRIVTAFARSSAAKTDSATAPGADQSSSENRKGLTQSQQGQQLFFHC